MSSSNGKHRQASKMIEALVDEVSKVIVGKRQVLERVTLGILARGHVLLEDNPGLAKTLTVRAFADALGLSFARVQFTPDLLPADITGSFFYDLDANRFELRKGPVFTQVLLADEINRAPPKTQSALLEAMQERQTTLEGQTHKLPDPFFVFATQNPIEHEGTYPLPEAQMDRFLLRTDVGYPDQAEEIEILQRREDRASDDIQVDRVLTERHLAAAQRLAETVRVDPEIKAYIVRLVQATRASPHLDVGASPRGSLAIYKLVKAQALVRGRSFTVPEDVKQVARPALAHRLIPTRKAAATGIDPGRVLEEILDTVEVPKDAHLNEAPIGALAFTDDQLPEE